MLFILKTIIWLIGFFADYLLCIGIYHDVMNDFENAFLTRKIDHILYTIKSRNLFRFLVIVFIMLLSLLTYLVSQLN
jgi:hypothetical protein